MFYDIQQQEELDYQVGMASEAQNALTWNRLNMKPDDSVKIESAIQEGKFVVVLDGPVYCPSTDALMGSHKALNSTHATRVDAEAEIRRLGDMGDIYAYVLPRVDPPAIPYVPLTDADLPF